MWGFFYALGISLKIKKTAKTKQIEAYKKFFESGIFI